MTTNRMTIPIKQLIDLSVPVTSLDTPVFPGYPQPIKLNFSTVRDNGFASNYWSLVDHTGTHVDAPAHFSQSGATIDQMSLDNYVLDGVVLDFANKEPDYSISREDIQRSLKEEKVGPGWILLFYTGHTSKSRTSEWMRYPGLSAKAVNYIMDLKVSAIGFDAPAPDHDPSPAHHTLLPNRISIYENLNNLDKLKGRKFLFIGTPLYLVGSSASPVRAFALVI